MKPSILLGTFAAVGKYNERDRSRGIIVLTSAQFFRPLLRLNGASSIL